jgi:hypothetical protein
MPESTRDRPTKSHEYVFLMSKSKRYFYDQDAIREPLSDMTLGANSAKRRQQIAEQQFTGEDTGRNEGMEKGEKGGTGAWTLKIDPAKGRNKRSVWSVSPKPYPGAHFAVWPEELVEYMVKAGSSQHGCCSACQAPWRRIVEKGAVVSTGGSSKGSRATNMEQVSPLGQDPTSGVYNTGDMVQREHITVGWEATCDCDAELTHCTVIDPFSGSATTGAVALRLGRSYIGIDLQDDYLPLAKARLECRPAPEPDGEPDLIGELFG